MPAAVRRRSCAGAAVAVGGAGRGAREVLQAAQYVTARGLLEGIAGDAAAALPAAPARTAASST